MKQKISLKVFPNSKKNEISEEIDIFGNIIYNLKTKEPPSENKANESVIKIVSEYFKVPKTSIKIKKGELSRYKLIEISST